MSTGYELIWNGIRDHGAGSSRTELEIREAAETSRTLPTAGPSPSKALRRKRRTAPLLLAGKVAIVSGVGPEVVFLCTGNAARSVMAGMMLSALAPQVSVVTAGTHVIEGQPMSWRTRDALHALGCPIGRHHSRQLSDAMLESADVVVGLAVEHVAYVRRTHPAAAGRAATLKRLCRDLRPPDRSTNGLGDRIAVLDLAHVDLQPWEDVPDPAGGDLETFIACATEIHELVTGLGARLT